MIKRLRVKFVCVFMVTVTVLLLAIFALICNTTQKEMRAASLAALQSASFEHDRPLDPVGGGKVDGLPGIEDPGDKQSGKGFLGAKPCFMLWLDPWGTLEARGSDIYDLSDEEMLRQILAAAQEDDQQTGVLFQWNLRYYRMDKGPDVCYAFLDISDEIQTMNALILACLLIGCGALAAFFVVAVLLARWLVHPVEEAFNAQRQFVADASHELKTPLTVIMTNAELLQSEDYDPPTKQRFASSIYTMSTQMRGLVESLLQLARVDNGTTPQQMQTVLFSELAEDCVLPFEPVYFEAGRFLESRIAPDIRVQGVEQQLHQVVDILLDNGRKYSAPRQHRSAGAVPAGLQPLPAERSIQGRSFDAAAMQGDLQALLPGRRSPQHESQLRPGPAYRGGHHLPPQRQNLVPEQGRHQYLLCNPSHLRPQKITRPGAVSHLLKPPRAFSVVTTGYCR